MCWKRINMPRDQKSPVRWPQRQTNRNHPIMMKMKTMISLSKRWSRRWKIQLRQRLKRQLSTAITKPSIRTRWISISTKTQQSIQNIVLPHEQRRFAITTITPTVKWKTIATTPSAPVIPNLCEGQGFDAVSLLRGELFIFKGEYVWRLTNKYRIQSGYPVKFNEIFTRLPSHVTHIDAIYERPTDGAIVLFHGNQYWAFDGNDFIDDSPRPISDYGFDENVAKIDAAMVWSKNDRTYLFAGEQFIRFDELTKRIDNNNYPANITDKWRGIPNNIDAATSVANGEMWMKLFSVEFHLKKNTHFISTGKTYFFKGNLYWLYNNYWIRPERGYPRRASTIWLGCPLQLRQRNQHRRARVQN